MSPRTLALVGFCMGTACTRAPVTARHTPRLGEATPFTDVRDTAPPSDVRIASPFALSDAGRPDANAPAAAWRGTICATRDARGMIQVAVEYATCSDALQCQLTTAGATLDLHAFWWGQGFAFCTAANIGQVRCIAPMIPSTRASRLRVDGDPRTIDLTSMSIDAGAIHCWRWPERTETSPSIPSSLPL